MNTTPANQKYKIFLNSGKLQVYGCDTYPAKFGGSVTRARIALCNPDCAAGAGKQIVFDRDVSWKSSSGWDGDTIFFGVGGNVASPPAGDYPEYITSWVYGGINSITGVTFTEDHQIGDLVENASRNVLFKSNSTTYHSRIYSTAAVDDVYDLNHMMIDEFGDATGSTGGAVSYSNTTHNFGIIDNTVLRNCSDGGAVTGFYISFLWNAGSIFTNNIVHDVDSGRGMELLHSSYTYGPFVLPNFSYYNGSGNPGYGMYVSSGRILVDLSAAWVSGAYYGINFSGSIPYEISDCLVHGSTQTGMSLFYSSIPWKNRRYSIIGNEIRNSGANGITMNVVSSIINNDIDNAGDYCIEFTSVWGINVYSSGNTYDGCNLDDTAGQGGVYIEGVNGVYTAENENYGGTTRNYRSNILWAAAVMTLDVPGGYFRGTCTNCLLRDPSNPDSCGVMSADGIHLKNCDVSYTNTAYMGPDVSFTLHNKDQVSGSHIGWGPGGMVFGRETAVVQDSTIALYVHPGNATQYEWFEIGKTYVTSGDALQVDLDLRKDEAMATAGWRPRLALQGCGFNRVDDYDEMSDVTDTWETTTVSGNATSTGVVHIYVGVRNTLSGGDDYTPTWPPTLKIFADGIKVSH